ncbi:MAG: GGDEF domain-containing protein [Chloroflexaceae bacterium]|nr:GGDEF domain-containing protein [Chloroflexaceae bacterium]
MDITEQQHGIDTLERQNTQLTARVHELEERNQEMTLLNELSERLHHCETTDTAYKMIRCFLEHLFYGYHGVLYTTESSSPGISVLATWGHINKEDLAYGQAQYRVMQQQATYRSKRVWRERETQTSATSETAWGLCIPISTHGSLSGMLQLQGDMVLETAVRQRWERLAVAVADHLGLALTNLHLRERLREQSIRDPLTGLFNRRYLDEMLRRDMHQADPAQDVVAVVMLDIDHFKRFNDTYGHDGGDMLLRHMGVLLQQHCIDGETVCRYGGEEFTLIWPGVPLAEACQRAEGIRTAIQSLSLEIHGQQMHTVTASLGVALFPFHGTDDEAVIKAADRALYAAKHQGRNRVVVSEHMIKPDDEAPLLAGSPQYHDTHS